MVVFYLPRVSNCSEQKPAIEHTKPCMFSWKRACVGIVGLLLLTLVVDAVCAAFFRTKARHLNASDSRTNGITFELEEGLGNNNGCGCVVHPRLKYKPIKTITK